MPKNAVLILVIFEISLSGCDISGSDTTNEPPPTNRPPTVDAGPDQSVDEGATVILSVTGDDIDGFVVSFSWGRDGGPAVTTAPVNASGIATCDSRSMQNLPINLSYCSAIEFVAPMVAVSEDLIFRITITDDDGATASSTVRVTVNDTSPSPSTSDSGFIPLGDLPGGTFNSSALEVSDDGSVVVGISDIASGGEVFRWTAATGMVGLGDLPGGEFASDAPLISADGSVMVGYGSNATEKEAVLWTSAGGMMGLGYIAADDAESEAHGLSADGSVVVGYSKAENDSKAFIWTRDNGMRSLRDVLIAKSATGLDGWKLRVATGISADGHWVVGRGINPSGFHEAFLANISAP
jgi:probable HAF family extracellular repeat protein